MQYIPTHTDTHSAVSCVRVARSWSSTIASSRSATSPTHTYTPPTHTSSTQQTTTPHKAPKQQPPPVRLSPTGSCIVSQTGLWPQRARAMHPRQQQQHHATQGGVIVLLLRCLGLKRHGGRSAWVSCSQRAQKRLSHKRVRALAKRVRRSLGHTGHRGVRTGGCTTVGTRQGGCQGWTCKGWWA